MSKVCDCCKGKLREQFRDSEFIRLIKPEDQEEVLNDLVNLIEATHLAATKKIAEKPQ